MVGIGIKGGLIWDVRWSFLGKGLKKHSSKKKMKIQYVSWIKKGVIFVKVEGYGMTSPATLICHGW